MFEFIEDLMEEQDISPFELSLITNIKPMVFFNWDKRKYKLSAAALSMLADFFGVTVDHLLNRTISRNCLRSLIWDINKKPLLR